MLNRRNFLKRSAQIGLVGATSSLWSSPFGLKAFAQMPSQAYKAIVVITMIGGNDGNNTIVPLDSASYAEYASLRGALALPAGSLIPLTSTSGSGQYGLHPSLPNIAQLYNSGRASVVANVGPLVKPITKADFMSSADLSPDSLLSHPAGVTEWEGASSSISVTTGWGGRIADLIQSQSGQLPPVLNAGVQSLFTVGQSIQAVAVQGGGAFPALPLGLQKAISDIAKVDSGSTNALVQQAAQLRVAGLEQQSLINQASSYKAFKTAFPGDGFGSTMKTVAQIIAGNSVTGATRQIFYTQQGAYDMHYQQLPLHVWNLQSLDAALGAFFNALDEVGMSDQVLVCTHSDFNRTYTSNTAAGSDHGWGSHQLLIGGGIRGGRVLGKMPTIELNGPDDANGMGIWIPTTSVTQLTSGIGAWFGLNSNQLQTVFPELSNFPGPLSL